MPGFSSDDDYRRARDVLREADYSIGGINTLFGLSARKSPDKYPAWLQRTSELTVQNSLVRLFYLAVAVPVEAACRALQPMRLQDWINAGLLKPVEGGAAVEAAVHLWPGETHILAADIATLEDSRADIVMPPGPISLVLSHAMPGMSRASTLDLGTGTGILALLAADCSDEVVAIDKNPRAIEFTDFNARLNGCNNVVTIEGDLFDPVRKRRFDLVISNPPFVIAPDSTFVYRDSGLRGDMFCRQMIREVPAILEDGGLLQMTCNLPHEFDRPWKDSLTKWFDGLGCDVVVWVISVQSPSEYAMSWIVSTESTDPDVVQQRYEEWMAYFDRERIEAVSTLLVTLRNSRSDHPWLHIDESPCHVVGPCGDELSRCFSIYDQFGGNEKPAGLLTKHCRLAPDIRIEQELVMSDDGLRLDRVRLLKTGGLQYPLKIDENLAGILARCNGRKPLGELIHAMATDLQLDQDGLTRKLLPIVRSLLLRSVLLIVEPSLHCA